MPQLYRMFKYRMIIKCHKFDQYDCTAAVTQRLSWPLPPAVYMTLDSNVFKISTNQLISDPSNTYKSLWNVHPVQCLAGYYHMTWSYIGCGLNVYKWGVKLIQLCTPGFADGNTNTVSFHWNWETVKIYWNSDSQESRDSAKDISLELLSHNMYMLPGFCSQSQLSHLDGLTKRRPLKGVLALYLENNWDDTRLRDQPQPGKSLFCFFPVTKALSIQEACIENTKYWKSASIQLAKMKMLVSRMRILMSYTAAQGQIGHPALLISYFALTLYLWLSFMHLTN